MFYLKTLGHTSIDKNLIDPIIVVSVTEKILSILMLINVINLQYLVSCVCYVHGMHAMLLQLCSIT